MQVGDIIPMGPVADLRRDPEQDLCPEGEFVVVSDDGTFWGVDQGDGTLLLTQPF